MNADDIKAYFSLLPYWTFAMATAGGFYGGMIWLGKHFRPEFKADLSNWLNGYYESTWTSQFCRLFDTVFGEKVFSWKRVIRSAIASLLSVLLLYILFAHVLGVLGTRTFGALDLWQALLIGAAVNIIPDYFSLIETRWLLNRFTRVQSVIGQIVLLAADLVFTAAIILIAIYAYQWLTPGGRIPSAVEIVALFSAFSIFFYSTFLTSVWAWIYCLSTWFVRLFTRLGLRRITDIEGDPVRQIALVGAGFVVLGGVLLGPVFKSQELGSATVFDEFICGFDIRACFHAARAADDVGLTIHFMEQACRNEQNDGNCAERLDLFFRNDVATTNAIWENACDGGYARACRALGWSYDSGHGLPRNSEKAVELYEKGCTGADLNSCSNLGNMYKNGRGIAQDEAHAVALFQRACDGDEMSGCTNLGTMYEKGRGVERDEAHAVALFQKACDDDEMSGCSSLGIMYENGRGVGQDEARAVQLYQKACDGDDRSGCNNLGTMYENGTGVEQDEARAVQLYQKACDDDEMPGCFNLGVMYENGRGVGQDEARAVQLYQKACDGDHRSGCNNLGTMYENGTGVEQDEARAVALYQKACDGDEMFGCARLGYMNLSGTGTAQDEARAFALFLKACDGGHIPGCAALGALYESGMGTAQNEARAVEFFQKACDGGIMQGCALLGTMYEDGRGATQDEARALELFQKACELGDFLGCAKSYTMYKN